MLRFSGSLFLKEHPSEVRMSRKKAGVSNVQVCKQLMEMTAKMTHKQGVEK